MSHITLIRHGQANTAARDEFAYDRLNPVLLNAVPHLETPDRHFAQTHL